MNALALMYVAVGGAFGAMCRYVLYVLLTRSIITTFPIGTFTVNILGSFLLGVWVAFMAYVLPGKSRELHMLFAIGALGGFTTFSTFAMDTFLLLERGLLMQAAAYIVSSVMFSVLALLAGMWLIRTFVG